MAEEIGGGALPKRCLDLGHSPPPSGFLAHRQILALIEAMPAGFSLLPIDILMKSRISVPWGRREVESFSDCSVALVDGGCSYGFDVVR